jgi:hypothetical protein
MTLFKTILSSLIALSVLTSLPASADTILCAGAACALPATCTAGNTWGLDDAQGLSFFCLGSNTWKPVGVSGILAIKKTVNLNAANVDIPLQMPAPFRFYAKTILVTGASTSLTTTAARIGIWTGAGATGVNIVTAASSQAVLQALSTSATVMEGNVGVLVTSSLSQVFLRVTVAHGSAATIDVYVMGEVLP